MAETVGDLLADRRRTMQRSLQYYHGRPPRALRLRPGDPDDNVLPNFVALVVDTGVAFLFGRDVASQVTGARAAKAQLWLERCWRANKRKITLMKWAVNGALTGQAFLKLVPSPDKAGFPRVVVLDPTQVTVDHLPDDVDRVYCYTIGAALDNVLGAPVIGNVPGAFAAELPTRQLIRDAAYQPGLEHWTARWEIIDQQRAGGAWVTVKNTPWPYPWPPILACQNLPAANEYWGMADLTESVIHLQAKINQNASHYQKTGRIFAHPKFWTRGMGNKPIDMAIDAVINLPSEVAELHLMEMQSDLSGLLAWIREQVEWMSYLTRTPMVAMGMPDGQGVLSGVALQIRYQPLIQKTDTKRSLYGDALTDLDLRLLELGGFGGVDQDITLHWPDLLPSDPLALRQELQMDRTMGMVSLATASERLGYDFDHEQQLIHAEALDQIGKDGAKLAAAQQAMPAGMTGTTPDQTTQADEGDSAIPADQAPAPLPPKAP